MIVTNLYSDFEQLIQHPDDRQALKTIQRSHRSPAEVVNGLGQLLRTCQTRANFIPTDATKQLLQKIKSDLHALENANVPTGLSRITSFIKSRPNPLKVSCIEAETLVDKSLEDIALSREEFAKWLLSPDAVHPDRVAQFVDNLKENPKKLLLFFETAINFGHWSLSHEKILSDCYAQLARFAAEKKIPETAARNLVSDVQDFHLEHITCLKCKIDQDAFYLDKILLAIKCDQNALERLLLSHEVQLPEASKKNLVEIKNYLESGQLPVLEASESQGLIHTLDYLGIPPTDVLLAISRQYRSCLLLTPLSGGQYKVTFREPVAQQALDLLSIEPCSWHIKVVDLSNCHISDHLFMSIAAALPHMSVLKLPFPNDLTEQGWGMLSSLNRLTDVQVQAIDEPSIWRRKELVWALSLRDKVPLKNCQWTIIPNFTPLEEWQALTAKQKSDLNIVPENILKETVDLLKRSPWVKKMLLRDSELTDAHLVELAGTFPQLTDLMLANCPNLSNEAIQAFIRATPSLTNIDLSMTSVSDDTIQLLVKTCPNLRAVNLSRCEHITDNALQALAKCHSLQSLKILNYTNITPQAAQYLTGFSLKELALPQQLAQGAAFLQIVTANPELIKLNLSSAELLKDEDVCVLAENCRQLVDLSMPYGQQLTDESIRALADNCPWLERVSLFQCPQITSEYFSYLLKQCANLRDLYLRECSQIDQDFVINLARTFPRVIIHGPVKNKSMSKAMLEPRNLR